MAGNIRASVNGANANPKTASMVEKISVSTPVVTVSAATQTLASSLNGSFVRFSNASQVTVTIPTDAAVSLPVGFWGTLYAEGAGGITLSTSGITLTGNTPFKSVYQNEALTVTKVAANTWAVIGGSY